MPVTDESTQSVIDAEAGLKNVPWQRTQLSGRLQSPGGVTSLGPSAVPQPNVELGQLLTTGISLYCSRPCGHIGVT